MTTNPVLNEQRARYAAVKARLGMSPRHPLPPPLQSPRLEALMREERVALPYIRPKRVRDVIHVASNAPAIMPMSPRKVIVREVCDKHGVSWMDITSTRRHVSIVAARNEAFYRLRNETSMSFPEIGKFLGGRDHSTVIHGMRRWQAFLAGKVYKPSWRGRSHQAFAETMAGAGNPP